MHQSTDEPAASRMFEPFGEVGGDVFHREHILLKLKIKKLLRKIKSKNLTAGVFFSSVGEMLDELQWPTLEARRDQSFLLFFHKIHCGIMSIEEDKCLTTYQRTRSTRSSHNSQYCRPQVYSDALKYIFFPRTIPHWNSLAPTVVAAETTEELRTHI